MKSIWNIRSVKKIVGYVGSCGVFSKVLKHGRVLAEFNAAASPCSVQIWKASLLSEING